MQTFSYILHTLIVASLLHMTMGLIFGLGKVPNLRLWVHLAGTSAAGSGLREFGIPWSRTVISVWCGILFIRLIVYLSVFYLLTTVMILNRF